MATEADYYGPGGLLQMRGYPVRIDRVKPLERKGRRMDQERDR